MKINCSTDRENLLKFEAEGREFKKHFEITKGQIKPKTAWRAVDSSKQQTNEFVFLAFLLFTAKKPNSFIRFLGESTARKFALEIN